MALNFPSPPYDGQIYTDPTSGSRYIYDSAKGKWRSAQYVATTAVDTTELFDKANSSFLVANASFGASNTVNTFAYGVAANTTAAFSAANSAFGAANNVGPQIAPTFNTANAAFAKANTVNASPIFTGTVTMNAHIANTSLSDSSGTISWDVSTAQIATVTLTGTGRTLANPTNLKVGTYILHIIQDSGGSKTITTWGSSYKFPGGVKPTLSANSAARDILSMISDGSNLYCAFIPDMS